MTDGKASVNRMRKRNKREKSIEAVSMDLKQFVKTAITEIVEGIVEAEEAVSGKGAHVNPRTSKQGTRVHNNPVEVITFDIALAQSQSGEIGGKLGVFLPGAGAGIGSKIGNVASNYSRIQFKIPVMFPVVEGV